MNIFLQANKAQKHGSIFWNLEKPETHEFECLQAKKLKMHQYIF